jgi:hypothetical protein
MSLQMRTTRTGFDNAFPPRFFGAQSELSVVSADSTSPQRSSGTRIALYGVPGIWNQSPIEPSVPSDLRVLHVWSGTTGTIGGSADLYLNMIEAPVLASGFFDYNMVPGPSRPIEPNGFFLVEYTLKASTATGFVPNTAASLVTDLITSDSAPSHDSPEDASGVFASAIEKAFSSAELIEFDDGIENRFTTELITVVKKWGSQVVPRIGATIFGSEISPEVAAQTLLCLGRIDDKDSFLSRSRTLRRGLCSPSAIVRDAAATGIGSLRDAEAMTDLAGAIRRESVPSVKEGMQAVLDYLKMAM